MKGTKVLTLSAHNLEKMMTTPHHQHSYLSSSVPVSQLMHSCTIPTVMDSKWYRIAPNFRGLNLP